MTIGAQSRPGDAAPRLGWHMVPLVFAECRPVVLVMFALRFVAGASLGAPGGWIALDARAWLVVVVGVLSWTAVTAAVYLYNGIADMPGDRLNGSRRPLASGRLPLRIAVIWCAGFAVVGILLGATLGVWFTASVIASLLIGWWYSAGRFAATKHVWSAALVIGLGGILTYTAGLHAAGGILSPQTLAIAVLLSLWMSVAGNTKDLGDIVGDREAGRRTLPVMVGMRPASWLVSAACVLVGLAGFAIPSLAGRLVAGCFVLAGAAMLAMTARGRDLGSKRMMYAVFMVSQLAANLVIVAMA